MANAMITPIYIKSVHMINVKGCCCELTRRVPIPDIMRFRLRHHVAFWKALSSIAPMFRANCCSRSVWLCAASWLGSSGRGRKDAIIHADIEISICIHAHDAERSRGGDLPMGKMKPMQKSKIWRF
jgi:hypothetical protein